MKNILNIITIVAIVGVVGLYLWGKQSEKVIVQNLMPENQTTTPVSTEKDTNQNANNVVIANTENKPDVKTDTQTEVKNDTQNNTQSQTIKDYTNLCGTDSICKKYYPIWAEEQMNRNGYDVGYFNKHIVPESIEIRKWNDGESFDVIYNINIDWASFKTHDSFIVKTKPGDTLYPAVKIARGSYLSKTEVGLAIDAMAYNGEFTLFKPADSLMYKTKNDALAVLYKKSGSKKFDIVETEIARVDAPYKKIPMIFTLRAVDTSNCQKSNTSKVAILDLVTGTASIQNDVCYIN